MNQFIFKTNIASKRKMQSVMSIFKGDSNILKWSIDLEDIDKVLKVSTIETTCENDVIKLVKRKGFYCEALPE